MNLYLMLTLVIFIFVLLICAFGWVTAYKKKNFFLNQMESMKISIEGQKKETAVLRQDIENLSDYAIKRYEIARELEEKNRLIIIQNEELIKSSEYHKSLIEEYKKLEKIRNRKFRMIIHDLKNPLNIILNVLDSNNIPEQHASTLRHQTEQMIRLITNILDVSRFEQSDIKINAGEFSISFLFGRVSDKFVQLSKLRSIGLRFKAAEDIYIRGDYLLLERVLINLLDNSFRFTPPLGFIEVFAIPIKEFIRIEVRDNGTGIHDKMLKKVFEEFISVNTKAFFYSNSTGIGLTFCKLAIEAHGGQIGIISNEGTGTRIWFIVPAGMKNGSAGEIIREMSPVSCTLSENEKVMLKNQIEELLKTDIHQVSEILKTLKTILPGENERIRIWKGAVENCVYSADDVTFRKLLKQHSNGCLKG